MTAVGKKSRPGAGPGMVRVSRQILLGLLSLVVGVVFAVLTIRAGFRVVPAIGFVLAVWGVVLLVNALLGQRLPGWPWGSTVPRRRSRRDGQAEPGWGWREPSARRPDTRETASRETQVSGRPADR